MNVWTILSVTYLALTMGSLDHLTILEVKQHLKFKKEKYTIPLYTTLTL